MKDNLEKSFRDSLKNYQEPYDPKAWESVSAQLGGGSSTGGTSSKALKWAIAGLTAVVVTIGTVYFWPNNDSQNSTASVQKQEKSGVNATPITNQTDKTNGEKTIQDKKSPIKLNEERNTSHSLSTDEQSTISTHQDVQANHIATVTNHAGKTGNTTSNPAIHSGNTAATSTQEPQSTTGTPVYRKMHYIAGVITPQDVCEGGTVTVRNPETKKGNNVRFQYNGKWKVLQPGEEFTFQPNQSTAIDFTDAKGNTIVSQHVVVNTVPSVNFDVDDNIYEKGLPVAICKTLNDAQSYQWSAKDQPNKKGERAVFNFFKQGDHKITLKIIDANGCSNSLTKVISIRKKYNLIAVDAFNPKSSDSRVSTFMPYALTVRDVKFHLTIIDPKDNHVVFTSKSADRAWDGVDQTTGKMTESNKMYIWNVRIENPQPNERPIYVGTVVHN